MANQGKLPRATGRGDNVRQAGSSAGPASYVAGGFTLDTGLLTIANEDYQVQADDPRFLATNQVQWALVLSQANGVITVKIYSQDVSGANAWAETAAAGDFSSINFNWHAVGAAA